MKISLNNVSKFVVPCAESCNDVRRRTLIRGLLRVRLQLSCAAASSASCSNSCLTFPKAVGSPLALYRRGLNLPERGIYLKGHNIIVEYSRLQSENGWACLLNIGPPALAP